MQPRPDSLDSRTSKLETGCGDVHVTLTLTDDGKPFEIFVTAGHSGGCKRTMMDGAGRLLSTALRSGVALDDLADKIIDLECPSPYLDQNKSCLDALGKWLKGGAWK